MSETLGGIRTVAGQEFRVRLRTGRWRWLLVAWFVVVTGFLVALRVALGMVPVETQFPGVPMFGGVMLWVLALALLVTPALSAHAINGDRERGTLATLQATRLSALEISGGKLLASWGTSAVFIALTLPHVVWAIAEGGVGILRAVVVLAVVLLLCGVICALALALSALLARGITSAVLSYCVVFALTVGTPVAFGLGTALSTEQVPRTTQVPAPEARPTPTGSESTPPRAPARPEEPGNVRTRTYTTTVAHPENVWWILAPNPFVVLADAAPELPPRRDPVTGEPVARPLAPLSTIGRAVRQVRTPDPPPAQAPMRDQAGTRSQPPVWPWGLGFDVLLGAAAFGVTVRRLRTPIRRLPRGVRIA